jgi:hypothetical protein
MNPQMPINAINMQKPTTTMKLSMKNIRILPMQPNMNPAIAIGIIIGRQATTTGNSNNAKIILTIIFNIINSSLIG